MPMQFDLRHGKIFVQGGSIVCDQLFLYESIIKTISFFFTRNELKKTFMTYPCPNDDL